MTEEQQQRYHFAVGFHHFDGHQLTQGVTHVRSEKPELTSAEALGLVRQKGYGGTLSSFAPISQAQYDVFEEEQRQLQRARARAYEDSIRPGSGICSVQ